MALWCFYAFGAILLVYITRLWMAYLRNLAMLKGMCGPPLPVFPFVPSLKSVSELVKVDKDATTAAFKLRQKLTQQFRNEGILLRMFNARPVVDVFKAELVEEVLRSPNFAEKSLGYTYMKEWLGNGLLTSNGPVWKNQRRLLTGSFHFKILDDYEEIMNEHSSELISSMKENPARLTNVKLEQWATDCTMSILLATVMGLESSSSNTAANRDHMNALNKIAYLLAKRFSRPWNLIDFCYFNSTEGKQFLRTVAKAHEFTHKAIESKMRELSANEGRTEKKPRGAKKQAFLDMLVGLYLNGEQLSIKEIREQTDTFMFAGYDTTGWTIAWTLFQLGHLPNIQMKLREEFSAVCGEDRTCSPTHDQLKKLDYFDRVLKECMRRYPTVPSISRRCTVDGAKLGPYRIPLDSTVGIGIFALHRDPDVFPEPEYFDPDRFLPANAQGRNPYAFLPFSAGARNCIGQRFAMRELRIILVAILRNFEIKSRVPLESIDMAGELILRAKQNLLVDFIPVD